MTTSIRKILFLFLALSITLPTHADIESEKTLLKMIHDYPKIKYDAHSKKIEMLVDVSRSEIVETGLLTALSAIIPAILIGTGLLLEENVPLTAFLICIVMSLPSVFLAKILLELIAIKNSNQLYVVIDHEGISCSDWNSRKKIYWNQIKNIITSTTTDQYGTVLSQKFIFKLNNGGRYPINSKFLPIDFNTFCDIIEYYWD